MLALGLIVIGAIARLIPHIPNFTPVVALALFGGIYLSRRQALIIPILLMMITDIVIGFHSTMFFTWGSVLVIALYGLWIRRRRSWGMIFAGSIVSAVLFFVITNFGAWLALYPRTWEGFVTCYTLAVPFFRMTLLSTLVYSVVLSGSYEWIASRVKGTRLETVLH